ncbi:MAG: divalent metal cation transporter [Candidatus Eremiobacteraeota bacterium]|nr:divalent metal cation transporter [Candidatus Eremiobacteraeota bacterium]MBC5803327.1 divalent metal cation transporter [Candidatus Eremiobacteraeota bacterium]MBC5822849.1 divalent metal cation transporter [Candidatus Eremiobacteraeota bacterium]
MAAMLGPGFITASAGNDVGGIFTYSVAGAQFGYRIIWPLIPIAIALIVIQEMAARMGAVTGKGLSALIREEFGIRIALATMLGLFLMNTFTTSAEFAGIASASEIFGLSRYVAVPLSLVLVFLLVLRVSGKLVERIFVVLSLVYVTYIVSGLLAHPNWGDVARGTLLPSVAAHDPAYLGTVVALIGTTISPYMQFYLQSAVVEKGMRPGDLLTARIDVANGSILAIIVAAFMIIANAATIYVFNQTHAAHPITFASASDIAVALKPLAGRFASALFAFGILNAGLFAAAVLPLSTSYLVCEALGFEAALDRGFREAPVFFSLFAIALVIGAALVLIPNVPLVRLSIASQLVQGLLLPIELVLMLIIVNRVRVMGVHRNNRAANAVSWTTVIIVGAIALYYTYTQLPGVPGGVRGH